MARPKVGRTAAPRSFANSVNQAFFQQLQPQPHPLAVVQRKHIHRCSSDGRDPLDQWTVPPKMVVPVISARMEEHRDRPSHRIDPSKIRAFLAIAEVARQSQVVEVVGHEMLPGDYVFHVVGKDAVRLLEPAVLAAISGSPAHNLTKGFWPHAAKRRCAFNLRTVIMSAPSINASYSASSSGVSSPSFARSAK